MTDPLVSIVIPTYNVGRYVGAAIDSILNQTYQAHQIIVVDDGSTDDTAERIAALGSAVEYVRQENLGIGAARNAGVLRANGDLLGFLDADDLFAADKTARQVGELLTNPELDMVFGHVEEFYSEELTDVERARLVRRDGPHPGYMAQTMVIRRAAFDRVGGFHGWKSGEFIDWYLRATESGLQGRMLPEVVLRRRLHRTNTGIRLRDSRTEFARVFKAAIDRRRAAAVEP